MAKSKRADVPGMYKVRRVIATPKDTSAYLDELEQEAAACASLEWLQQLVDTLEPKYGANSKDTDDAIIEAKRSVYRCAAATLDAAKRNAQLPLIVRNAYHLGRAFEKVVAQMHFDDVVKSARNVSIVNSTKSKPRLTDLEFRKVVKAIDRELDRGGDLGPSCDALAKQLTTGACRILPGRKVKIGGSALRKRYNKIKVGNTV